MNQARRVTSRLKDFGDPCLFAEVRFADKFDGDAMLSGQQFGIVAQLFPQSIGPVRVVEDADLVDVEVTRHATGIGESGEGTLENHAVEAGDDTRNPVIVSLEKRWHGKPRKWACPNINDAHAFANNVTTSRGCVSYESPDWGSGNSDGSLSVTLRSLFLLVLACPG
jgi:hypothetical protein